MQRLTPAQRNLAEQQASDWSLFAEFVDPSGAMARSAAAFDALPYAERLQAAEFSIRENSPRRLGRPPLPPEQRTEPTPVRTLRLSDEHWAELQARGGVDALRAWLGKRPPGARTPRGAI